MHVFEAEHVALTVREKVHFLCPRRTRIFYRRVGQLATLLMLGPIGLSLFTCIFHIPILPLVGLLMLMWLMRYLEDPMTRTILRLCWPIHRACLAHFNPDLLEPKTVKTVDTNRTPVLLSANPQDGLIKLSGISWDLKTPHHIGLERAMDNGGQIRLRLFQDGHTPVVLGADLPQSAREILGPDYHHLPRKEGEVVLMPWEHFKQLVSLIRGFHCANPHRCPPLLDRIVKECPQS